MSPAGSFPSVSSGPQMLRETHLLPSPCTLGFFVIFLKIENSRNQSKQTNVTWELPEEQMLQKRSKICLQ